MYESPYPCVIGADFAIGSKLERQFCGAPLREVCLLSLWLSQWSPPEATQFVSKTTSTFAGGARSERSVHVETVVGSLDIVFQRLPRGLFLALLNILLRIHAVIVEFCHILSSPLW